MALRVGDHLVIKREGGILPHTTGGIPWYNPERPETEDDCEFELVEPPKYFPHPDKEHQYIVGYIIKVIGAKVVK